MTRPSLAVIICVHNALEDVTRCLEATSNAAYAGPLTAIIVDDGSDAPTARRLQSFVDNAPAATLIRRDKARGYTNAANTGLNASDADICILLNSDTVPSRRAFDKIVDVFERSADIGIVGPLSNAASWQSVPELSAPGVGWSRNPLPDGVGSEDVERILDAAAPDLPATVRVPLVNGFCYGVRRSMIEQIGFFDEDAFPRGYGEEDDLCLRATDAGFGAAIAPNAFVYHAKSKSFGMTERSKLTSAGQAALKRKHGAMRVQRAVETMRLNPYLGALRDAVREGLASADAAH